MLTSSRRQSKQFRATLSLASLCRAEVTSLLDDVAVEADTGLSLSQLRDLAAEKVGRSVKEEAPLAGCWDRRGNSTYIVHALTDGGRGDCRGMHACGRPAIFDPPPPPPCELSFHCHCRALLQQWYPEQARRPRNVLKYVCTLHEAFHCKRIRALDSNHSYSAENCTGFRAWKKRIVSSVVVNIYIFLIALSSHRTA